MKPGHRVVVTHISAAMEPAAERRGDFHVAGDGDQAPIAAMEPAAERRGDEADILPVETSDLPQWSPR